MKIGSIPASYGSSAQESRLGGTAAGGGPRFSPVADVGQAVSRAGAGLAGALEVYSQQEQERRNFRALTEFVRMNGEVEREIETAKNSVPPDGAGYSSLVDTTYSKRYERFAKGLEPWQQEQFALRAEQTKQGLLTGALDFETSASRGFALNTIDAFVKERIGEVYDNPAASERLEAQVAELLENAPLSPLEKQTKAREIVDQITGTAFEGRVYGAVKSQFAAPGSGEAEAAFETLVLVESNGDPNVRDSLPHPKYGGRGGALGIAQVMPDTGREIARQLDDADFPFDGSEEEQKAYIRKNSYRYGKFYFEQGLREHNGDVLLASIRYNGGPGAVRAFLRGGRNPAALTGPRRQTREYVEKIWEKNGWGNPWTSPVDLISREGLSPEQRQSLNRVQDEFDEARLSAAQAQTAQDDEVLGGKIAAYYDDMRSRIFADPLSVDGELERYDVYLEGEGVPAEERARLVEATKGQVNAILAEREGTPEAIFDTEGYGAIPYEQRRELAAGAQRKAEAERAEALKQRKAAQDEAISNAVGLADLGEFNMRDLAGLVEDQTVVFGDTNYMKIKGTIERAQADNITALNVAERISAGDVFSPGAESRGDLAIYAKKAGIVEGLVAGDETAQAAVRELWRSTQVMPENVKAFLENNASALDPEKMMSSFLVMDTLQAENPGAFEREMGEDLARRTAAYRTLKGLGYPEETIAMRLNAERLMSPQDRKALADQAQARFTGSGAFTPQALQQEFKTWFAGDPVLGTALEQSANARLAWQDYSTMYREMYPLYGNEKDTHEAAMEQMGRLYGNFEGTLVKYPPQSYYPTIDQSHEWIIGQFRREFDVQPDEQVLIANNWTGAEERVRNGEVPVYDMVILRENGVPEVVAGWYGDFGGEVQYRRSVNDLGDIPITVPLETAEKRLDFVADMLKQARERGLTPTQLEEYRKELMSRVNRIGGE